MHPILKEHYLVNHSLREKGEMPDVAFMDFPKDETLKPEKDTRLINGCPIDLFIEMRRYLAQFFVSMRGKHTGIAIGMDVHSKEWHDWMSIVPDPIDEDYSNFGLTIHPQIIRAIKELAIKWCEKHLDYSEEQSTIVNVIMEEICCSTHVLGDLKYQVLCGSPSGAYGTDAINSLSSLFYLMYAYYEEFGNFDNWNEMRWLIYGDDLRRNKVLPHNRLKQHLLNIDKEITEDKTGRAFLKRQVNIYTVNNLNYVLAPLPPHVVVDILHWLKKPYFSKAEALRQRLEGFLNEVAHFGKSTYDYTIRTLVELGCTYELKTFEDWLKEHYPTPVSDISSVKMLNCGYANKNLGHLFFNRYCNTLDKEEFNELFILEENHSLVAYTRALQDPLSKQKDLLEKDLFAVERSG
jgi:hypothetical protein